MPRQHPAPHPKSPESQQHSQSPAKLTYSPMARRLHWWTVALIAVTLPLGVAMHIRGTDLNIWDTTTNNMYSAHKLLGFIILWLVIARLIYRFRNGAPTDEPTLEPWQKIASHLTHWALYALLIAMPIAGWLGVSLYGARDIFGLFSLPAIAEQNQKAAATVFFVHKIGAILMVLAIAAHVGAAIFHHFIRRDGVLRRMLPSIKPRD